MDRKCENGKLVLDPGLVNATKKIAPTAAARTRSTSKVCIFNLLCFQHGLIGAKRCVPTPPTVHMEKLTMIDATLRIGIHIDLDAISVKRSANLVFHAPVIAASMVLVRVAAPIARR
jgi:hypothetical protein